MENQWEWFVGIALAILGVQAFYFNLYFASRLDELEEAIQKIRTEEPKPESTAANGSMPAGNAEPTIVRGR